MILTPGEVKHLDTKHGRWYERAEGEVLTVPGVTTVLDLFPKGEGYDIWLGNSTSYRDALTERDQAAARGTLVHEGISELLRTGKLEMVDWETRCIKQVHGFLRWWDTLKEPLVIANECVVWSEEYGYAGTLDLVVATLDSFLVVDFKTGNSIYPSHYPQVEAYAEAFLRGSVAGADILADERPVQSGILHLKSSTQKGWQWCPVERPIHTFGAFLACLQLYHYLHGTEPQLSTKEELPTTVELP